MPFYEIELTVLKLIDKVLKSSVERNIDDWLRYNCGCDNSLVHV